MNSKQYLHRVMYLIGENKRHLPLLVFFFLISSVLDLIGISLVVPFISLIISPEGAITEKIYSALSFFGVYLEYKSLVLWVGLSMLMTFTFKALTSIFVYKRILRFCFDQGIFLRIHLMRSYQNLPYIDYLKRNSSEYIYNIQHVVELFYREVLQSFLKLTSELLVAAFIIAFLAWYDPIALVLLLFLIVGSIYIYDHIFKKQLGNYGEKVNSYATQIVKGVSEGIDGLKEIRILDKEIFFYNLVKDGAEKHAVASSNSEIISNLPRYFLEAVLIYFVVILSFFAHFIEDNLQNIVPTLSLFAVASLRLSPSSNSIINSISKIRFGQNSVDLLYQDMKALEAVNYDNHSLYEGLKHESFDSLELEKVNFTYPDVKRKVLSNVSMRINSGDAIGIMGSSGSGKTTLIDIMLGLLSPESGEIYYNGQLMRKRYDSWKAQIAYLPQQVFIIDDTVANNIALGVGDIEIDYGKLEESIQNAQLANTVKEMPMGINTYLGEKGIRLSGGERQRISLARAFYHNKNILIMDESTSALDSEIEREIVEEVKKLKDDKTLIIIAHRLSTLKYCDCIYQLENGEIIKSGTYDKMVVNKL